MAEDEEARRIWEGWHAATRAGDLAARMILYAEDATLETPLILLAPEMAENGMVRGKANIERFFGLKGLRGEMARWVRGDVFFFADGRLVWEYPRETPDGDQFDLIEMMEIERGLIARHRVYWGWASYKYFKDNVFARVEGQS